MAGCELDRDLLERLICSLKKTDSTPVCSWEDVGGVSEEIPGESFFLFWGFSETPEHQKSSDCVCIVTRKEIHLQLTNKSLQSMLQSFLPRFRCDLWWSFDTCKMDESLEALDHLHPLCRKVRIWRAGK